MSALLYRLINPPVKWLLRSPLHGLMSKNTLLLEFRGRKSGRVLSTPISYFVEAQAAHCFTSRAFGWWRNLLTDNVVHVTVRGRRWASRPQVVADDPALIGERLAAFLRAVPRDAAHAGVALDDAGNPDPADIQRVIPDMIYLRFPMENKHGETV